MIKIGKVHSVTRNTILNTHAKNISGTVENRALIDEEYARFSNMNTRSSRSKSARIWAIRGYRPPQGARTDANGSMLSISRRHKCRLAPDPRSIVETVREDSLSTEGADFDHERTVSMVRYLARVQGYLFANDIKMWTGIVLLTFRSYNANSAGQLQIQLKIMISDVTVYKSLPWSITIIVPIIQNSTSTYTHTTHTHTQAASVMMDSTDPGGKVLDSSVQLVPFLSKEFCLQEQVMCGVQPPFSSCEQVHWERHGSHIFGATYHSVVWLRPLVCLCLHFRCDKFHLQAQFGNLGLFLSIEYNDLHRYIMASWHTVNKCAYISSQHASLKKKND